MPKVYIKKFNKSGYPREVDMDDYPLSSWFPYPMRKAFLYEYGVNIYENDYILGPLYEESDIQVGSTGTLEREEKFDFAMARELGEEIGIVPTTLKMLVQIGNLVTWSRPSAKYKRGKKMKVYRLYIKDSIPVKEFEHEADLSKNSDDRRYKSGCFVHGRKKDVLKFLSGRIFHYKSPDDIVGVGAVRARDIYEHFFSQ